MCRIQLVLRLHPEIEVGTDDGIHFKFRPAGAGYVSIIMSRVNRNIALRANALMERAARLTCASSKLGSFKQQRCKTYFHIAIWGCYFARKSKCVMVMEQQEARLFRDSTGIWCGCSTHTTEGGLRGFIKQGTLSPAIIRSDDIEKTLVAKLRGITVASYVTCQTSGDGEVRIGLRKLFEWHE